MLQRRRMSGFLATTLICLHSVACFAQGQLGVTSSQQAVGNRFGENVALRWGVQQLGPGGGLFFNNVGSGPLPPFGGFDPASQSSLNFAGRQGNFGWSLGISASQGSSQSLSSQSLGATLPNGQTGFIASSIQTPFVTGIVPIVGAQSFSPVRERWLRLKYERAFALSQPQDKRRQDEEDVSPPLPTRPAKRPIDDPPLILK
jgi:hypothetical protein